VTVDFKLGFIAFVTFKQRGGKKKATSDMYQAGALRVHGNKNRAQSEVMRLWKV